MPLNAASYAEDLAVKAGKPPTTATGRKGKRRRTWKSFYGSVHDIVRFRLLPRSIANKAVQLPL